MNLLREFAALLVFYFLTMAPKSLVIEMWHVCHAIKILLHIGMIRSLTRIGNNWSNVRVTRVIIVIGRMRGRRRMVRRIVAVWRIPTRFCTRAHLFGHSFWHMFDDLHGDFVAHLLGDRGADFLGDFPRHVDRVFDADRFGEIFARFPRNEDGKVLAFLFRNFFALCLGHLFLHFYWNLEQDRLAAGKEADVSCLLLRPAYTA